MGLKIQYPLSGESPECDCVDTVEIEGYEYSVYASFDKILRAFDLLGDKSIPDHIKADVGAELLDLQGNPLPKKNVAETYRINYDGDLIYSAFVQAYGIDLFEQQGKLHFKKFTALLKGLPEDTQFSKICGIRAYKKPGKKDTYDKQMLKLQEIYKLPEEV